MLVIIAAPPPPTVATTTAQSSAPLLFSMALDLDGCVPTAAVAAELCVAKGRPRKKRRRFLFLVLMADFRTRDRNRVVATVN